MKLFRLRGGVHPESRKELAADRAIRVLPMPKRLYVPLLQHVGAPAQPLVNVGDKVLKGQLIGAGQGVISAPVHAPTSGRILAIGDFPAAHPSGLTAPTITIEADGEARWLETEFVSDPFALTPDEIAARVAAHQCFAACFSFFFFCFSLVESFGLLFFLPFSMPLATTGF